jgi:2-oxo-3-(phosphooxy)propyl 3-oxoalkanoate synthase
MTLINEITCDTPIQHHVSSNTGRQIIDKRFVHKHFEHNVLVSSVVRSSELPESDGYHHFTATFDVANDHDFFFEHPRNHVPGLYIIEAGRQLAVAITHLYYDIPFGVEFVMNQLGVKFQNFATTSNLLMAHCSMSQHQFRKGRLCSMWAEGTFFQGEQEVARMEGSLVLMNEGLLKRIERQTAKS